MGPRMHRRVSCKDSRGLLRHKEAELWFLVLLHSVSWVESESSTLDANGPLLDF